MNKKSLLALLLSCMLLLSSCSLIVKDPVVDAATEIIKVGDKVFTKAEVNQSVDAYLQQLQTITPRITATASISPPKAPSSRPAMR